MPDRGNVLIIDDDDFVRETICEVVEGFGYRIVAAKDGAQALASMQAARPDIVITDIIMPGISGLDVIAEIRRSFPEVKIVAISGGGGTKGIDNLAAASRLGSDWIIPKPIDIKELEEVLKQLAG